MRRFAIVAVLLLLTGVAENSGQAGRNLALTSPPSRFGALKPHQPFAVIMDVAEQKRVVSVLATSSGDASLYLSTGGAIMIRGVRDESVRRAANELIAEAVKHVSEFQKATKLDYPTKGNVAFFIRTPETILTATAPEWQLRGRHHPLSPFYNAGQKVITELRRFPMSK